MKYTVKLSHGRINTNQLLDCAFLLFFCFPLIERLVAYLCVHIGLGQYTNTIALIITYIPVFLFVLLKPKQIPIDFFVLLLGIVFFFAVTYLIHPEYAFWYERRFYGVWDYVLRPDNGIYAYFFIRLFKDPKQILRNLRKAAWFMYVYHAFLLYSAMKVGYWVNTDASGNIVHLNYDLSFGYNVLFFTLIFLFYALRDRKMIDIVMTIVGIAMILVGGSRGPFLCLAVFLIIYFLKFLTNASIQKKIALVTVISFFGGGIYIGYNYIMGALIVLLGKINLSTRTLTMFLQGNISSDNGRGAIWNATIDMIKENPLGYGAMGTRHVIYSLHDVGHCHQLFLEILVDFGVFIGGIIIVFLLISSIKILFSEKNGAWSDVFLIFFGRAFQLMLSGTYWHVAAFWACIGVGMSVFFSNRLIRRTKRINI